MGLGWDWEWIQTNGSGHEPRMRNRGLFEGSATPFAWMMKGSFEGSVTQVVSLAVLPNSMAWFLEETCSDGRHPGDVGIDGNGNRTESSGRHIDGAL